MRILNLPSTSFTLAALCTLSNAFPLFHLQVRSPAPNPQTYSVVAVDGGSSGAPSTATITNVLTQSQIQTIVSTTTISGSESLVTLISTQFIPTTIVQTVAVTVTEAEIRTVVVQPSVTSVPYDDGMWHTTYFYASTITETLVAVTSATSSASASSASSSASTVRVVVAAVSSASTSMPTNSHTSSTSANPTASTSTITITSASPPASQTTTASSAPSTTTDWVHAYGTWRITPIDGSWWGKGPSEKRAAAFAKLL